LANTADEAQQLSEDHPDTIVFYTNDVDYSLLPTPPTGTLGYGNTEIGAEYVTDYGLWLLHNKDIVPEEFPTDCHSAALAGLKEYFTIIMRIDTIHSHILIFGFFKTVFIVRQVLFVLYSSFL
jgi:hypothetical protein